MAKIENQMRQIIDGKNPGKSTESSNQFSQQGFGVEVVADGGDRHQTPPEVVFVLVFAIWRY